MEEQRERKTEGRVGKKGRERGRMGQKRSPASWWEQKHSLLRAQLTTVSLEREKTVIADLSPLPGVRADLVSTANLVTV